MEGLMYRVNLMGLVVQQSGQWDGGFERVARWKDPFSVRSRCCQFLWNPESPIWAIALPRLRPKYRFSFSSFQHYQNVSLLDQP